MPNDPAVCTEIGRTAADTIIVVTQVRLHINLMRHSTAL
jgi:hypothetical protein